MARLPTPGGDNNNWGTVLNTYLNVSHDSDGTLSADAVQESGGAYRQAAPILDVISDGGDHELGVTNGKLDYHMVRVHSGPGDIPFVVLPAPSLCDPGQILYFTSVDNNSGVYAYWNSPVDASQAVLGVGDGLFTGFGAFDYTGDPEVQEWVVNGDPVTVTLDSDYGDTSGLLASIVSQLGAVTFDSDNSNFVTNAYGSTASLQLVSINRGSISTAMAPAGPKTGTDSGFEKIGPGGLPWDASYIYEPEERAPQQQGGALFVDEDSWRILETGNKRNIASLVTSHFNVALTVGDPLDGIGFRTLARAMVEDRQDANEIASRLAQGRVLDGTDKDITVLDVTVDNLDQSTDKIVRWQISTTTDAEDQRPWITGKHLVNANSYSSPHTIDLPELASRMGGTVIVKADSSVAGNTCTVNAPGAENIDQPGGAAATYAITAAGVYTLEHLADGWAVTSVVAY